MLLPYFNAAEIEAGCDEAGRGCIAGPVCAAAVILPKDFFHPLLNDSKKLTEQTRYILRPIIEKEAIAYGVAFVNHIEIDKINILQASFKAMHKAVDQLKIKPSLLLIDGNRFKSYKKLPHECIIKGDGKYASIAAASILAKTYRDDYMIQLSKKYSNYHWQQNKGYPTKAHREAVLNFGMSQYHRKTFACLPNQLEINFDEN
ncbi:MAG TPA: ribonuclease HII [Chitinophagaceae bacterium]|nr:ribonuclease HII [Chitinophagaceae bacterium]